jgi:hypothetical protein
MQLSVLRLPAVARGSPAVRPNTATLTSAWVEPPPPGPAVPSRPSGRPGRAARAVPMSRVILPDVLAVAPRAITGAQFARLARLRLVRNVIALDGGAVRIRGHLVNMIGVSLSRFRAWTPPQTAVRRGLWAALARGGFVTSAAAAKRLGLHPGTSYAVAAATQPSLRFGGTAAFAIPRVDAVVSTGTSRQLGLVPAIGVLISAPDASLAWLTSHLRAVLGAGSQWVSLRPSAQVQPQGPLPLDSHVPTGRPTSYLQLFQESARLYCPGLSWTVLAAIGQIESGDGANNGPSPAGALGPMQFMPATWRIWGITGFGDTGPPNIMNPYDAVPSAARYLCAYNPGASPANLAAAIFGYNHATWYVAEVLALAQEYAALYH